MSRAEMIFYTIIFCNFVAIMVALNVDVKDLDLTFELILVPCLTLIFFQSLPTPIRKWLEGDI